MFEIERLTLRILARNVISYAVREQSFQEETWKLLQQELTDTLGNEIFVDCMCKNNYYNWELSFAVNANFSWKKIENIIRRLWMRQDYSDKDIEDAKALFFNKF